MGQFFKGNQILGRKGTIGCVFLEITQRCNLNYSLLQPVIAVSMVLVEFKIAENLFRKINLKITILAATANNSGTLAWNRGAQLWMLRRFLGQTFNYYNCGGGCFYGWGVRSSVKALAKKRGIDLKDDPAQ